MHTDLHTWHTDLSFINTLRTEEDQYSRYSLIVIKRLVEIQQAIVANIQEIIDGMPSVVKNTLDYHDLQVRPLQSITHTP